jgi:branched-chain amino acid transport system permease protein
MAVVPVDPGLVAQQLLNGLTIGAVYALIAVGLTLVFGILDVINFAHGEFVMFGAYAGFLLLTRTPLPYPVALAIAVVLVGALALVVERAVFRPLYDRGGLAPMMASFGLLLAFQAGALVVFGGVPKSIPDPFGSATLSYGGVFVSHLRLFAVGLAVAMFAGLWVFFYRTKTGKAIRATAQNEEAARIRGIDTDRVNVATFTLSGMFGAAGGVVYGTLFSLSPVMGLHPMLKAFAAIIIGGLGSVTGALVGGVLVGLTEAFGSGFVPGGGGWRDAYAFVLLVVVLLVRPQGLLGGWQR